MRPHGYKVCRPSATTGNCALFTDRCVDRHPHLAKIGSFERNDPNLALGSVAFTLIEEIQANPHTLQSAALFLLKMIKLIPSAFSPIDSPAYSAFAPPASEPDAAATASSPDTAASSQQVSFPSVKQAISAARHASALLSRAPTIQQKHAQAIEAALKKLETEMGPLGWSSVTGAAREEAEGGSVKRRFEDVGAREGPRRLPPPPMPSGAVGFPVWPAMIEVQPMALPQEDLTTPEGFWAVDSSEVLAASFDPSAGAVDPLDDLAISSLIGSDR